MLLWNNLENQGEVRDCIEKNYSLRQREYFQFSFLEGIWHLRIHYAEWYLYEQVHEVEFVVLCIGKYSGVPNIPAFPAGQGPEAFKGKVMHSMEYSSMEDQSAAELIKRKRVTVVGSQKSAMDIAAECANANGENSDKLLRFQL